MNNNPLAKARKNPANRRLAIAAACYRCQGGKITDEITNQAIAAEIRNCDSIELCLLWHQRPYRTQEQRKADQAAVAALPKTLNNIIDGARSRPRSRASAIRAKCYDCVGRNDDPNPRRTVRECTVTGCPLIHCRPWR